MPTVERHTNLVELFESSCRRFADRPLFGTKRLGTWNWASYRELEELVDALRAGLHALGVGEGDRVAIVSGNRVEWAVVAFAAFGLGASLVPMYEAQRAEEWRFILDDCGASVAMGSNATIVEKLDAMRPDVATLRHVIALEGARSSTR